MKMRKVRFPGWWFWALVCRLLGDHSGPDAHNRCLRCGERIDWYRNF
jgi:hypothetical protein